MNFKIIIESFKFYKLKSDKAVKLWLVLIILIRSAVTMLPIGDRNFVFMSYYLTGEFFETGKIVLPTTGNLIIFGLYSIGTFLAICIGLIYAEVFILENESKRTDRIRLSSNDIFMVPVKKIGKGERFQDIDQLTEYVKKTFLPSDFKRFADNKDKPKQKLPYVRTALKDLLRFIPGLLLLILLLLIVLLISSTLIMIPFIIVLFILLFTPLNYMYTKNKLARSMELSYAQTKGAKLTMFVSFAILNIILNFVITLFQLMLSDYHYSYLVIEAVIYTFRVLSTARLYSLFYQMLALRQPYTV
ncbi:MAG: hypothetical protein GX328_03790 [Clostridiaceae bacterium]|nr:hypothetical protein [Clostridiaceae bacterium]